MERKYLFYFFFIGLALIFIARLFYIQVIRTDFRLSAENNVIRKEMVYPGRGLIFDRQGKLLVGNQSAYDIMVVPLQVESLDTLEFCGLLGITKELFISKMAEAKAYSYRKPSVFVKQMSKEHYISLQEKLYSFKGFFPQKRILRDYAYNSAANVTGFIGEASDRFLADHSTYKKGDLVGITGIEKSYEEVLRGRAGIQYKMVDVHNRVKGRFEGGKYDTLPDPGADIICSIDIDLQKYGEQLMNGKRGSVVAIEPSSGEILALVTSPSYNPELMVGRERTKNYGRLFVDSIEKPLYDRGLLAEYPPGSPFKVVNALIGLQEGTLTPTTAYTCHHGFHYGRLHVACHCGTSYPLPLRTGISKSCNNYFCTAFKGIIENYPDAHQGMNAWSEHVKSFGLGKFLNNDLPTGRKGFVPDADYYDRAFGYTGWKAVSAISLGIGQGELLVTPIQLANMTAAIANRGYYYTPHILKKVNGQPVTDPNYTEPKHTTVDPKHFDIVIEGMFDAFEKGTARGSRLEGIEMCGKTGTAENPHGQDHSIFVAFAPKDDPKIAIAIIVENGYWGSRWAAPIASLMIEKYINGEITRETLEKRMLDGSLKEEYQKQLDAVYDKKKLIAENK
ncbi:penicillin-binding protein 2 [Owenweeksia hongkongensis DSM 17368]|uniref:Penicillin-binding protein 2 n=1 Tax=Owenweeksia hongkongensis (strain DSM 17368 / CIP 108786 / JCM 12287 / NRRL B-23963 / UST20020801) TaxID=926562 RepID=G8R5W2_OWEHD|nr:penicillin-binding protein 2 [Owenweeksia hongkongensis]AEV31110.1 penicillin-binding protein 2 [Owenweeksia hongkongensis DSM 17368]